MIYFLIITLFLSGFDIVLADNTTYIQVVDVHPSSFKCGHDLQRSLSKIFKLLLLPDCNDDIGKGYMKNSIKFYALQKCSEISDKCHNNNLMRVSY